ncbi:MAG TPA: glycoside hydrolase family 27 protein, partial [Acidobacteriota bacterium]|nr:glycoside hydrolase family 27 protein [Acidobacteriota bacterium]
TSERARAWAGAEPWTLGCNYIPRTAVNTLEMWQEATFDPLIIDQELGWAEDLGFNAVRVFLHYLPWQQDPGGFLKRLDRFLEIADKHHIGTMFVLFDDCWNAKFALGPQPAPRPGVHNSGWVQCPGPELLEKPARWSVLEAYTKGVIGFFREDRRVLAWDLYNEPGNSDYRSKSLPLVESVFDWARAADPRQPLTAGIWNESKEMADLNKLQAERSDIITFHSYQSKAEAEKRIAALEAYGRPLICTEYMARTAGSRFEDILPLLKAHEIGAMNWGFVKGKTQTIFPWGSKEGSPEPAVWFHDVMRPDGAPYIEAEAELIRRLSGKARPAADARSAAVAEPFHAWALTPPMGWNSWDSFGQAVTEDEVKANADFMAARLARLGWRYIVVDIEWSEPQRLGPDYPAKSRSKIDAFGRFVPAVERFPSAAGGRGFRPLADYVHRQGLKFGVHIVRGIPRAAVERNTPIEGTTYRAADIVDKADFCDWNEDQWGVDIKKPGAQAWYDSLFHQLAAWGVDFVKADDLCYRGEEIAMIRRAIDKTGRPIVLSLSYGPMPLDKADALAANANMWRLLGDLWDYWDQVLPAFRRLHDWTSFAGPGHWPDPDMLPLGRLRALPDGWSKNVTMNPGYFEMVSHGGREDVANFLTRDEQRTVMTLWAIAKCPLMFGGHLPESDGWTVALITNPEVIAVDQHSRANRRLFQANGIAAWAAESGDRPGVKYAAVFNISDRSEKGMDAGVAVPVRLADLGFDGDVAVTDVWTGRSAGTVRGEFAPVVPYHGAGLFLLEQKK